MLPKEKDAFEKNSKTPLPLCSALYTRQNRLSTPIFEFFKISSCKYYVFVNFFLDILQDLV